MFSSEKIILVGIINARIKIFTKFITDQHGTIRTKQKSFFSPSNTKSKPLEHDITLILVENASLLRSQLCNQLGCDIIPNSIAVLHISWLELCIKEKRRVPENTFRILEESVFFACDNSADIITEAIDGAKIDMQHTKEVTLNIDDHKFETHLETQSAVSHNQITSDSTNAAMHECNLHQSSPVFLATTLPALPAYCKPTITPPKFYRSILNEYILQPHKHTASIFLTTQHFTVIYDAYPKARVHLLILPHPSAGLPFLQISEAMPQHAAAMHALAALALAVSNSTAVQHASLGKQVVVLDT